MVTAEEIRKRLKEYELAQTTVCHFSGVTTAQLSRWLNGLTDLPAADKEAIDVASGAMASMIHQMYDIPIDFAKIHKIEPVVRKYMAKQREYLAQTRAVSA